MIIVSGAGKAPSGAVHSALTAVPESFSEVLAAKLRAFPDLPATAKGLVAKIAGLMEAAESSLERLAARLCLALPPGFELRQTVSMTRIKVVGFGSHGRRFEEAVNNDFFFRRTFQAIRVHYAFFRELEPRPASTYACFTLVVQAGRIQFRSPVGAGELFDRLVAELERARAREGDDLSCLKPIC